MFFAREYRLDGLRNPVVWHCLSVLLGRFDSAVARRSATSGAGVLLNLAPISPDGFTALVARVRDGGAVVSTTPTVTTPGDEERNVRAATIFVHPDADVLSHLVALIDSGDLHVEIAQRVPLSELPAIHQQADAGEIHGKVVAVPPAV
ncbi:zinc-binding dehydrogenase [Nocardia sp. CA-135953]|uniref:zinc-binding dehydrogenase n=1 Tax=Nocardia sp. CA-135953 TaxID=3239978 RepID=UPI003D973D0C